MDKFKKAVEKCDPARCERCRGLVKPDIVFFGEALPPAFFKHYRSIPTADLLIILGTSLTVHPFAGLAQMVPPSTPRVLINLEEVGDLGDRPEDVLLLGKCDDVVRELCAELGWLDELDELWERTAPASAGKGPPEADAEVEKITQDIAKKLEISEAVKEVVAGKAALKLGEEGPGVSTVVEEGAKESAKESVPNAATAPILTEGKPTATPELVKPSSL